MNKELMEKIASLDYDEMVKFAYEDILSGFEKSAEENDEEEKARKERKERLLKRLAIASAATAVPVGAIAAYKYNHRPGKYQPETVAFRRAAKRAMKGKPVEDWSDKVEIVTPGNSHHTISTPLLSAVR